MPPRKADRPFKSLKRTALLRLLSAVSREVNIRNARKRKADAREEKTETARWQVEFEAWCRDNAKK